MSKLTIIMYHYVRPIAQSNFPGIKGLEFDSFKSQLDYLEENYTIVSTEEVISAVLSDKRLPTNACWLTFDDGYKDHYKYVLPELLKREITAAFFPPVSAILQNDILDVNSIHYILSSASNAKKLVSELNKECLRFGFSEDQILSNYRNYAVRNRFDNPDINYFKRMLQHVLPEYMRREIVSGLFQKYVSFDKSAFAKDLYMNISELRELIDRGMFIGSHGNLHYWLNQLDYNDQKKDISDSLEFLEEVGGKTHNWIMCYPYGAYNKNTISILKELGAIIGLTTNVGVADLQRNDPMTLPRMDTKDFPT